MVKNIIKKYLLWVFIGLWFLSTLYLFTQAWTSIQTVNLSDPLTVSLMNNIIGKLKWIDYDDTTKNVVVTGSIQLQNVDYDCDDTKKWSIKYSWDVFYGCNGNEWSTMAITNTTTPYRKSCKEILDNGESEWNNVYWIDPNWWLSDDKIQVYCDMTTDGGWWTLIARDRLNDKSIGVADSTWPSMTTGIPSWDTDYLIDSDLVGLFKSASNFSYMVKTSWDRSDSRYILCNQAESILYGATPNGGSPACTISDNDNTNYDRWRYGISIHASNTNYTFIAFWDSSNAPWSWRQWSLFCNSSWATACRSWTAIPVVLWVQSNWSKLYAALTNTLYPSRDSTYTTWIFAR